MLFDPETWSWLDWGTALYYVFLCSIMPAFCIALDIVETIADKKRRRK